MPNTAIQGAAPASSGEPIVSITGLSKTYKGGFQALKDVNLDIRRGEIFALLGPNGAGKTTLISIVCGIVNGTAGTVTADGHDIRAPALGVDAGFIDTLADLVEESVADAGLPIRSSCGGRICPANWKDCPNRRSAATKAA